MVETKTRPAAPVVIRPTTYKTILVHAEPGMAATARVEAAARLARELDALLIGVGAEALNPNWAVDPYMGYGGGEWVALLQEQIAKDVKASEAAFRRDAAGADTEWRASQDYPHEALIGLARVADLIVVSPRDRDAPLKTADPADVVMEAGRPVLLVPEGRNHLRGQVVVIAWKNTRECRRAITDAMPMLHRAEEVLVCSVVTPHDDHAATTQGVEDVVANLRRHGVEARAHVSSTTIPEAANIELQRVATMAGADLIVAGAYGHSRLREWALGGVTDEFLHRPQTFVLLSH